jgi:hypothetical protein
MGDEANILLTLPWKIQVALASGYAAYLLGYRGIRAAHQAIDTAFITLIYGLVATSVLVLLEGKSAILVIPAAFFSTCIVALLWRKFFSCWLYDILHHFDISWSNDDPSAFATLLSNNRHYVTQIAVEMQDGTWLRCDDTRSFKDAPYGPAILGPTGDIALYLTHEEKPNSAARKLASVRDPNYGDRITYVPVTQIRQITMRHEKRKRKPNRYWQIISRFWKAAEQRSDSGSELP